MFKPATKAKLFVYISGILRTKARLFVYFCLDLTPPIGELDDLMKYCLFLFLLALLPAFARSWTNLEGRKIEAGFQSLEGGKVGLLMGGKVVLYPLGKLSAEDQDFARQEQEKLEKAREVKTGYYGGQKISRRLFPETGDYYKDRDRKAMLKAFESGQYWPETNSGNEEAWMRRSEGKDRCRFYVPAEIKKTSAEWKEARLAYRFSDIPGMGHSFSAAAPLKEALQWIESGATE